MNYCLQVSAFDQRQVTEGDPIGTEKLTTALRRKEEELQLLNEQLKSTAKSRGSNLKPLNLSQQASN